MSGWNFPQWSYGYTQMPSYPPQYYQGYGPPRQPRPPAPAPPPPPAPASSSTPAPAADKKPDTAAGVIKKEPVIKQESKPEDGELVEKSVLGILRGRNPVMYCNDQSKMRGLAMQWEQVNESGPPHDKTYVYMLKMGDDMSATGMGKNKKDAKTKAAEAMVLKLDELPRVNKRPYHHGGGGWGRGGYHGHGGFHGGPPQWKRKRESEESILKNNDVTPKAENPSQNNPISKLYEHCKKNKWPEPIFDCISEEVLEERRTEKGFTLRKTNFTMRCKMRLPGDSEDKVYHGNALTKKQAKTNVAAIAWAEINSGVTQASVDNLLSKQRNEAANVKAEPSVSVPKVPTQPKVVIHKH